jgi:hypothetical protein
MAIKGIRKRTKGLGFPRREIATAFIQERYALFNKMKRPILISILIILYITFAKGQEIEVKNDSIPIAILEKFKGEFPTSEIIGFEILYPDKLFRIIHKIDSLITLNTTIENDSLKTEQIIELDEIPILVYNQLKDNFLKNVKPVDIEVYLITENLNSSYFYITKTVSDFSEENGRRTFGCFTYGKSFKIEIK